MATRQSEFGEQYFACRIGERETPRINAEHELILKLMPPRADEKVLDVGCGKGRLGYFLLKQQPDIKMVFSDVSAEAKKYLQNQTFVECSMASMPFPDESFDKIFCLHVLAHFKEGEQGIREAFRILKKGGKLMIITPNRYYVYLSWIMTAIKKTQSGKRFKYDSTARWLYSKGRLQQQLNTCAWFSVDYLYFESAPRLLSFEWLRAKIVAVATK